jgi:RNA polymerase sigma-70 factor (ECF subfamily)
VVQETFLAVLRQDARQDPPRGEVRSYLLGIARHFVLRRLGAKYRAAASDSLDDAGETALDDSPTSLDEIVHAEMVDAVRAAIDDLPAPYRDAVVLCELEELDYAAAAQVMQCPIGTVRSRLHRARALLSTTLAALNPVVTSRSR